MGLGTISCFKLSLLEISEDPFARLDYDYFANLDAFKRQFSKSFKFKKLRDAVTTIETGEPVDRTDYALAETEYVHIVPRDIKGGVLDITDPIYLKPEKGDRLSEFKLVENDVLIAISSNCGDSAVFVSPSLDTQYTISHYMVRVKVNPKLYDPHFLAYYLNHPKIKTYFRAIEAGKTQQNLSKVYLRNFPVVDLPLEDQQSLVKTISARFEQVSAKLREIKTLEDESKQLIWNSVLREGKSKTHTNE